MTVLKIAVALLIFSFVVVTGLRLTSFSNFEKNAGSCSALPSIQNLVYTFLLQDMVFNGESGTLDAIIALVPQESVDQGAFLTIGLWNDNGDGSFTLRKILADSAVTTAGLLNLTFANTSLKKGDYFAFTVDNAYPICFESSPSAINYHYIFRGSGEGPKPSEGETFQVQDSQSEKAFAIAADLSQVVYASTTTGLPTSATATTDTYSPSSSAFNQTTQASGVLPAAQQTLQASSTTPTTTSAMPQPPANLTFLCQPPTNPCDASATCEQTFYGVRCRCQSGYRNANTTACTDIDECAEDNLLKCQQLCHNSPGSYSCSCRTGFTLANDGHRCIEQNLCSVPSGGCGEDFTCHSAGGYLQCLPLSIIFGSTSHASNAGQLTQVDLQETTWISDVWIIVFVVWSGLLSVLAVVLIVWMSHDMKQTKLAIEMEILQDSRLQDSGSASLGSTLRHGMRFHDGIFTAMKQF